MMEHDAKEKRRKRVRRVRLILAAWIVGIALVCTAAGAYFLKKDESGRESRQESGRQKAQKEQLEKQAGELLSQRYAQIFTEQDAESFAQWFFAWYPEETREKLAAAAADGILTDEEIYQSAGETLYVLADRCRGFLEDAQTAAEHQIYIREGTEKGAAQIAVAGDLCLTEDGFVIDHYDEVNDLEQCISPEILKITNGADIFYLNHEYAISGRGAPLPGKYYTFRADPKRMALLTRMGTDIVSLANNHVYDYGREALEDTVRLLEEAGIPYVGGGRNLSEAVRPVYFIVNGIKIGFVGASNAEKIRYTPQATEDAPGILLAYDTAEYNRVIKEASAACDYLIAYIHWGTEDTNEYNAAQQSWGREFLASGADIVIGGHPHVLQGIEYVDGKPIVYSLGDFWFNHETKYTGVLRLRIGVEGLREMSFVPCLQTGFTTKYLAGREEQKQCYAFLERLSPNVAIDSEGVITQKGADRTDQKVVVIDPGHQRSGESALEPNGPNSSVMKARVTGGTSGVATRVPEYELNLAVSLLLRAELENRGYTVYMTRTSHDVKISNMERAQYATGVGADIAVRIHANGAANSSVNGAEVLVPSAKNPYISHLADASYRLGKCILDAYCAATGISQRTVYGNDTMTGINWSTVPVAILEMGYMSNPDEDRKMQDPATQASMARGIADGIDAYFGL